jgi:cysteine synthase A
MARTVENAHELIGETPVLHLLKLERALKLKAKLYAKLEMFNPGGSVKDRIALNMIEAAERSGRIKPGDTLVEPTSGNTGIGLAAIGASKGYRVILVMPDTMSVERQKLLKAYGAQVILSSGSVGMKGAIAQAERIVAETPNTFMPSQFTNPANPDMHHRTTGPELWAAFGKSLDVFVAGVGTGGTITGAGRFLKEQHPAIEVIASEPFDAPLLAKGIAAPHKIQGWGPGFIPDILDQNVYDDVKLVKTEEAYAAARLMARTEGLLIGISSGAALHSALEVAQDARYASKTICVLFPDGGERYLSTPLFEESAP